MKNIHTRLEALEADAATAKHEKILLIFDDGTQKRGFPADGIDEMMIEEGKPRVVEIHGGDGEPVVRLLRGLLGE